MPDQHNTNDELLQKIRNAPVNPGCYLFKDTSGRIIYAGKAKNLRARVKSYFLESAQEDERLAELLPRIADVEYRPTASELDALFLEFRLIKQYRPFFNSQMKQDVPRPYLRIGKDGSYATFSVSWEAPDDGAGYFDFFINEDDIKQTLIIFGEIWRTPQCGRKRFMKQAGPCLYYSLGKCMGPCAGKTSPEEYGHAVLEIQALFQGKNIRKMRELRRTMKQSAAERNFELAEQCRQQLESLRRLRNKSRRINHYPSAGTVAVMIRPYKQDPFNLYAVKNGQVMHGTSFVTPPGAGELKELIRIWESTEIPLPETEWLGQCLIEVIADKRFVTLPERISASGLLKEITQFYNRDYRVSKS